MEVVSINIAQTKRMLMAEAEVASGILKAPVPGPVKVGKLGLEGDYIADKRYHGGLDQAVYLYSADDYGWWTTELGHAILPGTFGDNITLAGLDSSACLIGDRLQIGELELELSGPRLPCAKLAARMRDSDFVKKFFAARRPGVYARVIKAGEINIGDRANLQKADADHAAVMDVFEQWHSKEKSLTLINKILASPVSSLVTQKLRRWQESLQD